MAGQKHQPKSDASGLDASNKQNTNPVTGRPIRLTAGRKSLDAAFADSQAAISDDEEYLDGEDSDVPRRQTRKRKRTPTPSPPSTPRHLVDGTSPNATTAQSPRSCSVVATEDIPPISLTFNVPKGHSGPFVVNIDLNNVLKGQSSTSKPVQAHKRGRRGDHMSTSVPSGLSKLSHSIQGKTGFLDLPAELRNQIYRHVFVDTQPFNFSSLSNLSHSAAFLRTCRQVAEEGASILYSENKFHMRRNSSVRTPLWSSERREIGFRDMRLFFKSIGSTNIARIRKIHIVCEDAAPSLNPHLSTTEQRRFVNDDYLMASIKLLGQHGRIQSLDLEFYGRKTLQEADYRFLDHLKIVRADLVTVLDRRYSGKVTCGIRRELIKIMTRQTKLYDVIVEDTKSESSISSSPLLPAGYCYRCGGRH